jgi:hypothetical protein
MAAKLLNIAGLIANLVGVILLFLYGMPYRVRTGGNVATWTVAKADPAIVRVEWWYTLAGWIGLALIVIGQACKSSPRHSTDRNKAAAGSSGSASTPLRRFQAQSCQVPHCLIRSRHSPTFCFAELRDRIISMLNPEQDFDLHMSAAVHMVEAVSINSSASEKQAFCVSSAGDFTCSK